ncbi:MAG: hypothetical protein JXA69_16070 [Phycisphaerae bacterium]|nr:hypothetical protein [Phycisphaerae bacterium]
MRFAKTTFTGLVLGLSVCTGLSVAVAETIYVDASATGANNGTSWADAYTHLQSALARPPQAGDKI